MTEERYAVVVAGGTPGGIAAGVRAAREGHETLLVPYDDHLGGMMASGLSYSDTLTTKERAPILEDFVGAVRDHYRSEYGVESDQYAACESGYVFEPSVAESILSDLVADEPAIEVSEPAHPASAQRSGSLVESVTFEPFDDGDRRAVAAAVFVDATYEGDLAAAAGAPWRVGREGRREYGEQFAGRLFTGARGDRYYPRAAVGPGNDSVPPDRRGPLDVPADRRGGDLDLIPHPAGLTEIFPKSTGVGDDAVQAYNYRFCLSRDPDSRRRPERPDGYDRTRYVDSLEEIEAEGLRQYLLLRHLPNDKADMNAADLPGENHDYPTADWERRRTIAGRHRRYALGLLYFLQNDDAVTDDLQTAAREWGLATDEFVETDNVPRRLYVREARRIEGRYVFTEDDARHAPGIDRTPIAHDGIAIAEYPLDSHACSSDRQPGSEREGFFYASQVTRPSQIPYRALLPEGIDNLLVPVAVSASHVGYGTIRVEPTWMHLGESAGFAAALARDRDVTPAAIDPSELQRRLVERGVMVAFFNGVDMATDESWLPAVQFLATRGLFASYDARPTDPLAERTAAAWIETVARWADPGSDEVDATHRARAVAESAADAPEMEPSAFRSALESELECRGLDITVPQLGDDVLTRGAACELLYDVLEHGSR